MLEVEKFWHCALIIFLRDFILLKTDFLLLKQYESNTLLLILFRSTMHTYRYRIIAMKKVLPLYMLININNNNKQVIDINFFVINSIKIKYELTNCFYISYQASFLEFCD